MDKKEYAVCVELRPGVTFDFSSFYIKGESASRYSYVRIGSDGVMLGERGVLSIDEEKCRIGYSYDTLTIVAGIESVKVVDGNYHYVCSWSFGRMDVYICEPIRWNTEGESIFAQ